MEDDALDRLVLRVRRRDQVPGNRLALAVGVGREDQLAGVLD